MTLRESDLPGIGKKFELTARSGDRLVIVIHDDGRRECYHFDDARSDESASMITLDDDEARMAAAIIGGMTYKPKALETAEMTLDDLVIEWYRIEASFACVGQTIGELDVRQVSGATVLAVIGTGRGALINPGPDVVLQANTTVVAAGERGQQRLLKTLLVHGKGGGR